MWFKSNNELFDRNADGLTEPDLYSVNIYGTLYFRNGVKYQIDKGRVRRIVDRNGNFTQLAYCGETQSACSGEMLLEKATDPLGRTTTFAYNCTAPAGQECHTITYSGYNGTLRVIKVTWGEATSKLRADLAGGTLFPELNTTPQSQAGLSPLKVLLADSTSNYDIYYNRYGEVARIVLPTGGAYDYEYGKGFNNTESGIYASGQVLSRLDDATNETSSPPWSPFIYRRLVKRREHLSVPPAGTLSNALDALASGVTTYETAETATTATYYSPIPTRINGFVGYGAGSVTVTTFRCIASTDCAPQNRTVSRVRKHEFSVGKFDAGSSSTPRYGIRTDVSSPGKTLTLVPGFGGPADPLAGVEIVQEIPGLEKVRKIYGISSEEVGYVCQERRTLSNSITSQEIMVYGPYHNLADRYEYGYGAGPIADDRASGSISYSLCPTAFSGFQRRTHHDYVTTSSYLTGTVFLPGLISSTQVFGPGGLRAQANVLHDCLPPPQGQQQPDCALDAAAPSAGHESSTYGTGFSSRGNARQVSRLLNAAMLITQTAKYDVVGNLTNLKDGRGFTTFYSYESSCSSGPANTYAFLKSITNAKSHVTTVQWDCNIGRPVSITDPNNAITTATYNDAFDRLKSITRAGLSATSYNYFDPLQVQTIDDRNTYLGGGIQKDVFYDGLGRVAETRLSEDGVSCSGYTKTLRTYDSAGRQYEESQPHCSVGETAAYTRTEYDQLDRVIRVTEPGNAVTQTDHSVDPIAFQRIATVTDPATKQRRLGYDGLGRLVAVREGGTFDTTYIYNELDLLTNVTQGAQARIFTYDTMGRLTDVDSPESRSSTNPDWRKLHFEYDETDNMILRKAPRPIASGSSTRMEVNYTYDQLGRLGAKIYNDGTPTVIHYYDQDYSITGETGTNAYVGRLSAVGVGPSSAIESRYRYDKLGRVTASQQTVEGMSYAFHYDYVPAGMSGMRYPSGRQIAVTFDAAGRANGVTGYVSQMKYRAGGVLKEMTLANGVVETRTHNDRLQPTGATAVRNSVTLLGLGLSYGSGSASANNGNVTGQTITAGSATFTQSYTYDALNRLETASETNGGGLPWSQTFVYDRYGNRSLTTTLPWPAMQPAGYDATTNRANGWTFDGAGNVTLAASMTMTYDGEDRLVQATGTGLNAQYTYDGEGRRVKSLVGGTLKVYVYDASGALAAEYGGTASSGRQYVTADHLGSTRMLTDGSGTVVERRDYAPFGEEVAPAGCSLSGSQRSPRCDVAGYGLDGGMRLKYTGKERDAETGLDYFGARYAGTGRFTSPDRPFADQKAEDPQSWNLYGYVRNNPLRAIDTGGREMIDTIRLGQYITGFAKGTVNRMLDNVAHLASNGDPIQRAVNSAVQTDFRFSSSNEVEQSGMRAGYSHGETLVDVAVGVGGKFASKDPLVGKLANEIESAYPGHVKGVNVPIKRPDGTAVTDADIVTGNAIIQVKSGGGKGLADQLARTENATGQVVIGYGPDLKPSVVKDVQTKGGLVTKSKETLLKVIRPDEE